ncbi:Wzy polymerase domain-containing protein [Pseudomonas sp. MAHUQ-62]|uniref:PglL family O-oligosaccharyltransferase n=1 Tax=Pseudomonas sp. GCM10023245 TaxID=3252652 RepID=UPI003612F74D
MRYLCFFGLGFLPFVLPYRVYPDPLLVSSAVAFLLVAILLLSSVFRLGGLVFGRVSLSFLLLGALLVVQGSFLGRVNPTGSFFPGFSLVICSIVVAMFSGMEPLVRARVVRYFALGLVFGGGLNALAAWGQWLDISLGWPFLGRADFNQPGVYGNVGQRNVLVSYLFVSYFAMMYLATAMRVHSRYVMGYALMVGATAAITGSRTAIVYSVVVVVLPLLYRREVRDWLRPGVTLVASFTLVQVLLYFFGSDLTGIERLAVGDAARLDEYAKALGVFRDNWLVGIGMQNYSVGSFEYGVRNYLPTLTGDAWTHPHNLFLMLMAGEGVLGVVLCAFILVLLLFVLSRPDKDGAWCFGVGGLACIFVHSQIEYPLWVFGYFLISCVLLGVVIAEKGRPAKLGSRFLVGVGLILSGGIAIHALYGYSVLVKNYYAVDDASANVERVQEVYRVSINPLISRSADLVVLNYLVPSKGGWKGSYCLFEKMARDVPSYTILDRMGFYAWYAGEGRLANSIWRARQIYYPDVSWDALSALFGAYYVGDREGQWNDFLAREKRSFDGVVPYVLSSSRVCSR